MKKAKKIVALLLCAVLLVGASVAGTLAYLTSTTDEVKNTFTAGKVQLGGEDGKGALDEAKVDLYGDPVDGAERVTSNEYKLIPGHEYTKDPTLHVAAGSEPCYLFVKVVNGISAIEAAGNTTIAAQMTAKGWNQLTVDGNPVENVFYYNAVVDAGAAQKDVVIFEKFILADTADVSAYEDATITITGYAVQSDGFDSAAAAWKDAPTTWTKN